MTDILENELVQKYFSCEAHEIQCRNGLDSRDHMAFRVLASMRGPIHKGEKVLRWDVKGPFAEAKFYEIYFEGELGGGFHPYELVLPDRFQAGKKECDCHCQHNYCGCGITCTQPPPAPTLSGKVTPEMFRLTPLPPGCCQCAGRNHEPECPIGKPALDKCTCHYTDERVEDPKCPRHKHDSEKAVEEKIMEISQKHGACSGGWEHELRELVELAKRGA